MNHNSMWILVSSYLSLVHLIFAYEYISTLFVYIAIQETNERMEHELKSLKCENDRLTKENDKVESAVEKWVDLFN